MNNKKAFSLIEVLVVILIVGILTAVALPQYQKAVIKGRFSQALTYAAVIRDAEYIYHTTYNTYTTDLNELDVNIPGCEEEEYFSNRRRNTYVCAQNYKIMFSPNTGVEDYASVYVLIPPDEELGVEFYFFNETRLCHVPHAIKRYTDICKSAGGVPYSGQTYFKLP